MLSRCIIVRGGIFIKGLFNDNESNIDYIGYKNYISVFKYVIDNEKDLIEPPIVFGLHGDWGIGKSTFMKLLSNELEKNEKNITIRINPWEYKNGEDIVSLFFIELYKKLCDKSLLQKLESGFDKLFELIYPLKLKFKSPVSEFEYDISKIKEAEKINMLNSYINDNHLRKENIKDIFKKTFLKEYKVIVFVDDLDRCSVDKVINILESIKLFLNTNRCIFFLGCDINYLNSAVGDYYEKFIKINNNILNSSNNEINRSICFNDKNSINKFTKEYLEKIIQVPFHIPPIDKNSMELYIDSILDNDKHIENDMKNQYNTLNSKGNSFKVFLSKKLIKELFAKRTINPRRIKRVLNIIYLNYLFLVTKMDTVIEKDLDLLALLAIINDEDQNFYKDNLCSKEVCSDTFNIMFEVLKKSDDDQEEKKDNIRSQRNIDKQNIIESLFDTYFNYKEIRSKEDIVKNLENITNILTVSNTTHIVSDCNKNNWGVIGDIESISQTNRKVKTFLNNIDNEMALDFSIWFLKDIFLEKYICGNLQVGIYNNYNLLIFKSEKGQIGEDYNGNYLMKFTYESQIKNLKVVFDTGRYTSKLNREILSEKEILINENNIETIKEKIRKAFEEVN